MVDKSVLDGHLAYTAWATNHLLKAVAAIPAEQLAHNFKTADRSIIGTLAHIFAADRLWLDRVHGRRRSTFIEECDRDLVVLQGEWPALFAEWRRWVAAYPDARLGEPIAYVDMAG